MCFSATASFVAGAALVSGGTVVLAKAQRGAELPYAAIPILFGVQQLMEGVIWLTFADEARLINQAMTWSYSFFSHVFWPLYVPMAVLLLEPVAWRRRCIAAFGAAGSAAGLYLLVNMFRFPIEARPVGGHIEYVSPHFYALAVMAGYLGGTCLSLLFSSHRRVNLFGAAALGAFIFAYAAYTRWMISVWCFLAAVLSLIAFLHFRGRKGARA